MIFKRLFFLFLAALFVLAGCQSGTSEDSDAAHETVVAPIQKPFIAGEHYVVLDKPFPTRNRNKIEVVELFSYGCPHCYEFEPLIKAWSQQQADDVDFWFIPAVWNKSMELYARAFYSAQMLDVGRRMHLPLFNAIVVEHKGLGDQGDLADFFANHGIDRDAFTNAFHSTAVGNQVKQAEARTRGYKLAGVPEIIVNGKYRVERTRAGGQPGMLTVVDFLINKERAKLKN